MRWKKRFFLLGLLVPVLSACVPAVFRPTAQEFVYDYLTASAKYDGKTYPATARYSAWIVETEDFVFAGSLVPDYVTIYTDGRGGIAGGGPEQIEFDIRNKRNEPFEIVWASSSIVLPNGTASRVMHKGQKFIEKDRPAAPTLVPPGAVLSDLAAPSDLVYWNDASGSWVTIPMFKRLRISEGVTLVLALNVNGERKYFQMRWEAKKLFPPAGATSK